MKETADIPRTTPDSEDGRLDAMTLVEGRAGFVVPEEMRVRSPRVSWASAEGVISPLGPTWVDEARAYNFSLYSRHAERVTLLLFGEDEPARPLFLLALDPRRHKTWDVWHCRLGEDVVGDARHYAYVVEGPRAGGPDHRPGFDPEKVLLDPYAKDVFFPPSFDRETARQPGPNAGKASLGVLPRREPAFDWGDDRPDTTTLRSASDARLPPRSGASRALERRPRPGPFGGRAGEGDSPRMIPFSFLVGVSVFSQEAIPWRPTPWRDNPRRWAC